MSLRLPSLSIAIRSCAFAHLFFTYFYTIRPVEGPSMLPTFNITGDSILVSRLHSQSSRNPFRTNATISSLFSSFSPSPPPNSDEDPSPSRRPFSIAVGDIVVLRVPTLASVRSVKRVLGMPGDYVLTGTPGKNGAENMLQVPPGHCWVVGDNLSGSRDSRTFGPVPLALVQGKVLARLWPMRRPEWFTNPLEVGGG